MGIPQHQRQVYKCECGDSVWEPIQSVKFVYDRLNPMGVKAPMPAPMFRCIGCKGFLVKGKDGYKTVHPEAGEPPVSGDEWKRV